MDVKLLVFLFVAVSGPLFAQQAVTLRPDEHCVDCRIEIQRSIAFGDADGEGTLDHSESRAVRDSRGNFVLNGNYSTMLKVYDSSGRFRRTIGRAGSGPGEFRGVGAMDVLANDTLAVFDWGNRRYSLFSESYEYLATGPLPLQPEPSSIALATGEFVFNATIFTANEIGQPLHRVGRDGELAHSFGSRSGVFRPDIPHLLSRAIGRSSGWLVWSALRTNYHLELFDSRRGTTIRSLKREVPWFPPGMLPVRQGQSGDLRPMPFIYDVVEDSTGLLWVLIGVADPQWSDAIVASRTPGEGRIIDDHGYRDTVLEVIDPVKGTVLATARMEERVTQFVGAGLVGTVLEEGFDGIPKFQTWTVRLLTSPSGGSK